jgi:hypothetical protein
MDLNDLATERNIVLCLKHFQSTQLPNTPFSAKEFTELEPCPEGRYETLGVRKTTKYLQGAHSFSAEIFVRDKKSRWVARSWERGNGRGSGRL